MVDFQGRAGIQGVDESVYQEFVLFRDPSVHFSEGRDDTRGLCVFIFTIWVR
jgi:hypothetical protein